MNAPDKIYVHEASAPELAEPALKEYHVEYICKDALLKCVKDLKEQMKIEAAGCSNMLAAGEWLAYDKLVEKIESM